MVEIVLPRYVSAKRLADGRTAYYWGCPRVYKDSGCPWHSGALGVGLSQAELDAAAEVWNERLDEWKALRDPATLPAPVNAFGTIDWLFGEYLKSDAFLQRVSEPSRPDYARVLKRVADMRTLKGDTRYGDVRVNQFGVKAAERVYQQFFDAGAARTAEKAVIYAKTAWERMRPHYPRLFRADVPNPWVGVTIRRREKRAKSHVGREDAYRFAELAIEAGHAHLAAAPVLAFEFFMRPSAIAAGWAPWTEYRGSAEPDKLVVKHRKNGGRVVHPLEDPDADADSGPVLFYARAESIFDSIPRIGMSMVTKRDGTVFGDGTLLPKAIAELAAKVGMSGFTLDQCRHGGMTELEEAGLTEGQGKTLSTHRSRAYQVYAKETEQRVLAATRKRFGYSESAKNLSESTAQIRRKRS
jgi:integrase